MTRDEIIRMAREAKLWPSDDWYKEYGIPTPNEQWLPELERFATLVAAAEREACAKVCEDMSGPIEIFNPKHVHYIDCAAAIRARGGKHDRKGN
jgi:hypothetical protein